MTIPAESGQPAPLVLARDRQDQPHHFNGSPGPTLAIEVEYQIIDPESGELAPGGPQILEAFNQPAYAKEELLQSTVELDVGPCKDVGETRDALSKSTSTSGQQR